MDKSPEKARVDSAATKRHDPSRVMVHSDRYGPLPWGVFLGQVKAEQFSTWREAWDYLDAHAPSRRLAH